MGQSKNDAHKRHAGRKSDIPIISIDYGYLTRDKKDDKNVEDPQYMPTLHMHDRTTGMIRSDVVPTNGANPHAADNLRIFIEELGYPELILKSDQEA